MPRQQAPLPEHVWMHDLGNIVALSDDGTEWRYLNKTQWLSLTNEGLFTTPQCWALALTAQDLAVINQREATLIRFEGRGTE